MTITDASLNVARAREFLERSGALQIDALLELINADVVLELPFALPSMPKRLEGKADVEKFLRATADSFTAFGMTIEAIYPVAGRNAVIVEHRSKGVVAATNRVYENCYVTIFEFTMSGEIAVWKEYFDPGAVLRAFT